MNDIIMQILYSIIGGFILTNISLIIFQVVSYHPYSRPVIPLLFQSITVLFGLAIIIILEGDDFSNFSGIGNLLQILLAQGIVDVMIILPVFYVLMLYYLFRASIRTMPDAPLLELLDTE